MTTAFVASLTAITFRFFLGGVSGCETGTNPVSQMTSETQESTINIITTQGYTNHRQSPSQTRSQIQPDSLTTYSVLTQLIETEFWHGITGLTALTKY